MYCANDFFFFFFIYGDTMSHRRDGRQMLFILNIWYTLYNTLKYVLKYSKLMLDYDVNDIKYILYTEVVYL